VSAIGYWRKRTGVEMVCMTLLLGFTVVWLTNGSQDRQNIALLLVLLLLGTRNVKAALICLVPYLLAGVGGLLTIGLHGQSLSFKARETLEGSGNLLFTVTYLLILCWFFFSAHGLARAQASKAESSSI